jgi:hypothetical protein
MTSLADLRPAPLLDRNVVQFTDRVLGAVAWATAVQRGYDFMLRRGEKINAASLERLAAAAQSELTR